ncbi:hypothetical protein [Kribbella sp.]|uniref:hypothetical protein n=1 Tax=Kribbella sp. TaxID=1871183 RepID=UPI002D64AACE|nr:hypothetical protein [Kribbella sp.]HZX07905.1 hypothetical protein [Kribbella sp.]
MNPPDNHQSPPQYVDVTIIEFAAHTAYLDPLTGIGYLLAPRPDSDVAAPADPLVEAAWSERLHDLERPVHLSLHGADRQYALAQLGEHGWEVLYDEDGQAEIAGTTADGREALCIYGQPTLEDPPLDAIDCAIIALDIAADLDLDAETR